MMPAAGAASETLRALWFATTGDVVRDAADQAGPAADLGTQRFHVVVFGIGSAGKTSLVNALLGRVAGTVGAVMGTTRQGEGHTHTIDGVEGTLLVTDTPGLGDAGEGGADREAEARDLAARADLLLFVVAHDLTRTEYESLVALIRLGKRCLVILNKTDLYPEPERAAILARLRERLEGVVAPTDVVAVAASPRPIPVRLIKADGSQETILEVEPPDLGALEDRIAAILEREGDVLRAGTLLLRARLLNEAAQEQLGRRRRERALAVIERYQWIAAGTAFANPISAFGLMVTGAVQFQMISELAGVYGIELAPGHAQLIGGQMIQTMMRMGTAEAVTSLIAGAFKSSFVGFMAGGAIQAATMAYLTRISGRVFLDYFERGQTWGRGGMQEDVLRQLDQSNRSEFIQGFIRQVLSRVLWGAAGSRVPGSRGNSGPST